MNRRSGKTTEMLGRALREVRFGRSAAVVLGTEPLVSYCKHLLCDVLGATPDEVDRIVFYTPLDKRDAARGRRFHRVEYDHSVDDLGSEHPLGFLDLMLDLERRRRPKE